MTRADFIQPPCGCAECVQAGVSALEQIRDWRTGKWLHSYDLKRWYAAREQFYDDMARVKIQQFGAAVVSREPGEEG